MTRTAVVTGAYGYLGSVIRARLSEAGWSTVAFVRKPRSDDRAVEWSLDQAPRVDALLGVDALVHCAYDFNPRSRRDVWQVNVDGTKKLLEAAKQAEVERMVVLSSLSAYAGTTQIYGQAKLAIEEVTVRLGGLAVRPGLVYGDEPAGMAGALVKLLRLPVVPIFGDRAYQFPVHEDDLAGAIVEILDAPEWRPEVFGIAQPTALSFRKLLDALAARHNRRPRYVLIPWQAVYGALRLAEVIGFRAPLRADSVLGLVRPAPYVPRSIGFPSMLDRLRLLE